MVSTSISDPILCDLGRQLLSLDAGLGLFRLVHLLEAIRVVNETHKVSAIVSVGSGGGLHEAFLARMFPEVSVVGLDLREAYVGIELPNLSFHRGDVTDPAIVKRIPQADLVYSIECLEHIVDDSSVASAMASVVVPGGAMYLEVPFASEADLMNAEFVKEQLELHEHVRPGYTAAQLRTLIEVNGLEVDQVAGAFWFPMQPLVWFAIERFGIERLLSHWREFLSLAEGDIRSSLQGTRSEATAIKALGFRRTTAR
jgi:SAM-dependent methyltransferase